MRVGKNRGKGYSTLLNALIYYPNANQEKTRSKPQKRPRKSPKERPKERPEEKTKDVHSEFCFLHPPLPFDTDSHQLLVAARPFIKWAGGKSKLIEQYKPFLPTHYSRYHEPFLGGGALFFHLAPQLHSQGKRAYLSDLNPELVNVYTCVRDQVEPLIEQLASHQTAHSEEHYYEVRSHLQTEPIARAARFIYLNKTCYNGLYRENSKGLFNVPMGRYKKPNICAPDLLRPASAALQIADISERPFHAVSEHAKDSNDFVYFDPPYHPLSETSKFTAYSRYRFAAEQQTKLRDLITQLSSSGVQVLTSNSDCPFIRELYTDFQVETITAARSINSKASKRGKITEVLAIA